jgi:hypothetical protein
MKPKKAKSNFCPIGDFLNLVLAGLRLGLKNRQVGEKWVAEERIGKIQFLPNW